jgi:hypothetical protein
MGAVMTKPSVGTRDGVPAPARDRADRTPPARAWVPWTVAGLGLIWLIVKLWAAHQQIHDNAGDTVAIATAALAIPSVVQATALGGLGGGLAARLGTDLWRVRRSAGPAQRWLRYAVAATGGLIVGLGVMGTVLGAYGNVPSIAGVAVTVVITGTVAGALVGIGKRLLVPEAALAAALASFVADTILNSGTVLGHMMAALGAGRSAITDCDQGAAVSACAKVVNANSLVSHVDSVIVGLVAGLVAFWYLRRRGRGVAFPAYELAGAATGLLLLATEALTHLGGAGLVHVARSISADDRTVIDLLAGNRVIHGLLVLFVGAIVALIAFGRTLRPSPARAAARARVGASAGDGTQATDDQRSS